MTDTPNFIMRKQFEIIQAKSVKERFGIFDGMMHFVRQMAIKRIKKQLGEDISQSQLTYELIKEYYGKELSNQQMTEIKEQLLGQ